MVLESPLRVQPQDAQPLVVSVTESAPQTARAALRIDSNDPERPTVSIALQSDRPPRCALSVSPPHSVFSLQEVRTLQVRSEGDEPCALTSISTDQDIFELLEPPQLPLVLEPQSSLPLRIQHRAYATRAGAPIRSLTIRARGAEARGSLEGTARPRCLEVENYVDFSEAIVNSVQTRTVQLHNRCAWSERVLSARLPQGAFDFDPAQLPIEVPAGAQVDIEVMFRPFQSWAQYIERLELTTSDPLARWLSITLVGAGASEAWTGQEGYSTLFPHRLDLGGALFQGDPTLPACATSTGALHLFSRRPSVLRVQLVPEPGTATSAFELIRTRGTLERTLPMELQSPADVSFSFRFVPQRVGAHRAHLQVRDERGQLLHESELLGEGHASARVVDTFSQPEHPQVDMLWVVDNSGSMAQLQARLNDNIPALFNTATALDIDYQMAVTTTEWSGALESCPGHPAILRSDYADAQTRRAAFQCAAMVGTRGSPFESGLRGGTEALQRAQRDPQGLLRSGAHLAVIIISDEDDISGDPVHFARMFRTFKPSLRALSFHAIISLGAGCGVRGETYIAVSDALGGQVHNICDPDWTFALEALQTRAFAQRLSWRLSQRPAVSTMLVTVDGVPVPQDPSTGFRYDPGTNAVVFSAAPAPGAEVVVTYESACLPSISG